MFKLKRNRPVVQATDSVIQAWLWTYQTQSQWRTVRLILLGNEHIAPAEHETWPTMQYRAYRMFHGQLTCGVHDFTRNCDFEPIIRIYPNYIAFELPQEVEADPIINHVLEILRNHMKWSEIPMLQLVHSPEEFRALNERHNNRWPLGSHQLGSR